MKQRLAEASLCAIFLVTGAAAQVAPTENWKVVPTAGCDASLNYEQANFKIGNAIVSSPFSFLPWVHEQLAAVQKQVGGLLDGKPFVYSQVINDATAIIDKGGLFPDSGDERIRFTVQTVEIHHCKAGSVDIEYGLYSSQISALFAPSFLTRQRELFSPQAASGLDHVVDRQRQVGGPGISGVDLGRGKQASLRFVPIATWNRSTGIAAGGHFEFERNGSGKVPFSEISANLIFSNRTRYFGIVGLNRHDSDGSVRHLEWGFTYRNRSDVIASLRTQRSTAGVELFGISGPVFGDTSSFRFGFLGEIGRETSATTATRPLSSSDHHGISSLHTFAALDSRWRAGVMTLAYEFDVGTTFGTSRSWTKHLFTGSNETWFRIGDHRALDAISHLALGTVSGGNSTPLSELWVQQSIPIDSIADTRWEIQDGPVFRALPAALFSGTKFVSYNLDLSYPLFRVPMVPKELTAEPVFQGFVEDAITLSQDEDVYVVADPNFPKSFDQLKDVQSLIDELKSAVTNAQGGHPGQLSAEFHDCSLEIGTQTFAITSAYKKDSKASTRRGVTEGWADQTKKAHQLITKCNTQIAALFSQPFSFPAWKERLLAKVNSIASTYRLIDMQKVKTRAKKDSAFVSNTLRTLIYNANIIEMAPILLVDVARMAQSNGPSPTNRFGLGGGIRITAVSSVSLSVGYMKTVQRIPQGHSWFVKLSIRDLFSL